VCGIDYYYNDALDSHFVVLYKKDRPKLNKQVEIFLEGER